MDYNITYREKDKSIQCIISYKDANGKWKQKSKQGFKTQKASKSWINDILEKLEEEIKLNELTVPELKGITFKELMRKYIAHKEIHREYGSIVLVKYAWKKFEELDDMLVSEITNVDTQNCVDKMVKEKLAYNTLTNYIALIKAAFYYVMDKQIIKVNPLHKMTVPKNKKDDKIKALNKWELDDLISKIRNIDFKMVSTIAGTCGLRVGEILGLTWNNIDFNKSLLTVKQQWKPLSKNKKGIGDVKRQNSNRVIPIPKDTLDELKIYNKIKPTHTTKRIFYNRTSGNNLSKELSTTYRSLGYDLTVHDLRHTYATLLIGNGIDFKTAAEFLGHDVETTIKTYSHVTDEMRVKATNIINEIF